MQLIRSEKHRPLRTDAPHSVYDYIKLKRNNFCRIVHFVSFPLMHVYGGYASNGALKYFFANDTHECLSYPLSQTLLGSG